MKSEAKLSTLILAVLTLITLATQAAVMVSANPIWATFLPQSPDKSPPTVNVSSPINNQEYNMNNFTLNVTVSEPDAWFRTNEYGKTKIGEVSSVQYSVDGQGNWTLYVGSISLSPLADHPWNRSDKAFSVNLTGLAEGLHTIAVYAEGMTAFLPDPDDPFKVSSATVSSPPVVVTFRVAPAIISSQNDGFFPINLATTVIGTLVIAALVTGILVYWKKRKR